MAPHPATEPAAVHSLRADQLRVLANPLRETILGLLCREPLSAARIADRLEDPPRNLHYHLERLRSVGLIELVEERPVRGATEKLFRAVASNFAVGPEVFADLPGPAREAGLMPLIRRHGEWVLGELGTALSRPSQEPPLSSHQRVRLSAAAADRLRRQLLEFLEDCRRADGDPAETDGPPEEWILFTTFFRRAESGG